MIVYLGVVGVPESLIPLEFDSMKEASAFSDEIRSRYMETENKLYIAIDADDIYKERSNA